MKHVNLHPNAFVHTITAALNKRAAKVAIVEAIAFQTCVTKLERGLPLTTICCKRLFECQNICAKKMLLNRSFLPLTCLLGTGWSRSSSGPTLRAGKCMLGYHGRLIATTFGSCCMGCLRIPWLCVLPQPAEIPQAIFETCETDAERNGACSCRGLARVSEMHKHRGGSFSRQNLSPHAS